MDLLENQIEIIFRKHYALKESIDQDKEYNNNDISGIHKRLIELQLEINELKKVTRCDYTKHINTCYDECVKLNKNISINNKIYLGHIYVLYVCVMLLIIIELLNVYLKL